MAQFLRLLPLIGGFLFIPSFISKFDLSFQEPVSTPTIVSRFQFLNNSDNQIKIFFPGDQADLWTRI